MLRGTFHMEKVTFSFTDKLMPTDKAIHTESVTDLDQQSEMIMTFFQSNIIFEAAGEVAKIGLSLQPNHHNQVKVVHVPDTLCIICSKSNFL